MKKQRSKSQRARRNHRRRVTRIANQLPLCGSAMIAIALNIQPFVNSLREAGRSIALGFDGARPDSLVAIETQTGKIVDMNTTTKVCEDE